MAREISDFRSDTVTQPTEGMRRSMATAPLGDDVIGHDPTVERLQCLAAQMLGKESALFVASGTMGNVVSLITHCRAGEEVILGERCHIIHHEVGAIARFAHAVPKPLPDADGLIDPELIAASVRDFSNIHNPRTALICLENTHQASAGAPVPVEYMSRVRAVADRYELAIHLDGARLFNAAVALGVPASDLAAAADSVTFCLSKGLCCPAGSLLCGSRTFIDAARRVRKALGGGMRQVGVLAAPGIIALETMIERLADDHRRARQLAEGLAPLAGIEVDPDKVHTNIIYLTVTAMPAQTLQERLADRGVSCFAVGNQMRLVTHHDLDDWDIDRAINAFEGILRTA